MRPPHRFDGSSVGAEFPPLVIALIAMGCGAPHREPAPVTNAVAAPADARHVPDPDLDPPPRAHLLSIDWSTVKLDTDADALAVWKQIAPTGADWEQKLDEVPADHSTPLALALLREGNFTCVPPVPATGCATPPIDEPVPPDSATLADPCLRRVLALWAFDQLEPKDLPAMRDALKSVVAIPPPESQLVQSALSAVPDTDPDLRTELLVAAWKGGQHELVNAALGGLDEAHAKTLLDLHVDGVLEVLTAKTDRAAFLRALADEQLATAARTQAIAELVGDDDKLAPDLQKALVAATRSADCAFAAAAARTLELHGNASFVPRRPKTATPAAMMRGICVLASYETLQRADEVSLFPGYLPARGLELAKITYDPYNDVDSDGDGDPHTERTTELVARDLAALPEGDDLIAAMKHCTGTTCRSEWHELRFTFKPGSGGLVLWRLEVVDRPPCKH